MPRVAGVWDTVPLTGIEILDGVFQELERDLRRDAVLELRRMRWNRLIFKRGGKGTAEPVACEV